MNTTNVMSSSEMCQVKNPDEIEIKTTAKLHSQNNPKP